MDERGKPRPPKKNDKGTPQGGVISPLLANLYLHWIDKRFHEKRGPFHWANARLIRYEQGLYGRSRKYLKAHLQELGLLRL